MWLQVLTAVSLVLFGGLMSGLTLGLLSLEDLDLKVTEKTGTEREQRYCQRIRPLIHNQHLLLVTLLLCNAGAMEALPLVLDQLVSPVVAVIISVTAVLAFGEIIPQAVCKTYGLAVGAATAPLVRLLLFVCMPVAWPIAKLLDCTLGHGGKLYRRAEIKAIVDVHREKGEITHEEEAVIDGAFDLATKTAKDCMTSIAHVKLLDESQSLDAELIASILAWGHSRIPVFDSASGGYQLLLVKELIRPGAVPDCGALVGDMPLRPLVHIKESMHLYELLSIFKMGRSHMALVYPDALKGTDGLPVTGHAAPVGLITLEDVVEELIQGEIVDETDRYVHVERPSAGTAEEVRKSVKTPRVRHPYTAKQRSERHLVQSGLSVASGASPVFVAARSSLRSVSRSPAAPSRFASYASAPGSVASSGVFESSLRKPLLR